MPQGQKIQKATNSMSLNVSHYIIYRTKMTSKASKRKATRPDTSWWRSLQGRRQPTNRRTPRPPIPKFGWRKTQKLSKKLSKKKKSRNPKRRLQNWKSTCRFPEMRPSLKVNTKIVFVCLKTYDFLTLMNNNTYLLIEYTPLNVITLGPTTYNWFK